MVFCPTSRLMPILVFSLLLFLPPYQLHATTNSTDAGPYAGVMTRILSVTAEDSHSGTTVHVVGNGRILEYTTTTLDFPLRVVFDFRNPAERFKPRNIAVESEMVKRIRLGYHQRRIRLVLDIKGDDIPTYMASSKDDTLTIFVKSREGLDTGLNPQTEKTSKDRTVSEGGPDGISGGSQTYSGQEQGSLFSLEVDDGRDDTALLLRGINAYRDGDWPGATGSFADLIEAYPKGRYAERAYFLLAKSYRHLYSDSLPAHVTELKGRFQDAINRFPDSVYVPEALFAMGNLCYSTKTYYEALAYYNIIGKKYEHSRVALSALMQKARILALRKNTREALSILEYVRTRYSGMSEEIEAKVETAKILHDLNNFNKSLDLLLEITAARPDSINQYPAISLYLGYNYYQLGDNRKARENLYRFFNCCPDDEKSHLVLTKIADTYRNEGLQRDAVKLYQLVLERYPGEEGALISLFRLAEEQEEGKLEIERGITSPIAIIGGEIAPPEKIYEGVLKRILKEDEKNLLAQLALLKLAIVYHRAGDYEKSLETLKMLLSRYPLTKLRGETRLTLDRTLSDMLNKEIRRGRYRNILNLYQREKDLFLLINSPGPFLTLARAFTKLKLTDFATEMFAKVDSLLSDEEKPADLLFYVGADFFEKGELEQALSRLDLLTEHHPGDQNAPFACQLKGRILAQQGQYASALQKFSTALSYQLKGCDRARILADKARALMAWHRNDEALRTTREADQLKANCCIDYHHIYREIGDLFLDLGVPKEALRGYRAAVEVEKKEENKILLKLKMAQCYRLLNQKENYLSLCNEIASLNVPFWSNLARENMEEINFRGELDKVKATVPPKPLSQRDRDRKAVRGLLTTWQQAWQNKNLSQYMACYSENFSSRGISRKKWERYKARLNERYANIEVTIGNLKVEFFSPTEALVSFDQGYHSDQYQDWGRKTMRLKKQHGGWKIQSEAWLLAAQEKRG